MKTRDFSNYVQVLVPLFKRQEQGPGPGQGEPALPVMWENLRGMEVESRPHRPLESLMPHTQV